MKPVQGLSGALGIETLETNAVSALTLARLKLIGPDFCLRSLFSSSWMCSFCALDICLPCYRYRFSDPKKFQV